MKVAPDAHPLSASWQVTHKERVRLDGNGYLAKTSTLDWGSLLGPLEKNPQDGHCTITAPSLHHHWTVTAPSGRLILAPDKSNKSDQRDQSSRYNRYSFNIKEARAAFVGATVRNVRSIHTRLQVAQR